MARQADEFTALFGKAVGDKLKGRDAIPYGVPEIDFLPSGIFSLDKAIGGGLPKGRITEISGLAGTSKTSTGLIISQNIIRRGGRVAWFEAEEALDPNWMNELGIPDDEVYREGENSLLDTHFHIYHPPYLENGLENIRILAPTNVYDLIVYDSVGGSPTLTTYEADIADAQMTQHARVLGKFCAVMPQDLRKGKAAVLMLNHVYQDLSQKYLDPLKPFGGKLRAKGGEGMAFLSTIRIMMYLPKVVRETGSNSVIGKEMKGAVYKNKIMWKGMLDFTYNLMFDPSYYFDSIQDILDTGAALGVIEKRGTFFFYEGTNIGQGDKRAKEYLMNNQEQAIEIVDKIYGAISNFRKTKEIVTYGYNDEGQSEEQDASIFQEDAQDQGI